MMFTGSTIDELMNLVDRVEADGDTRVQRQELTLSLPALQIYSEEQFQKFGRERAFVGVA